MGKEAEVEALWPDGARGRGRLQYEPPKLVYRGDQRLVFEGKGLAGVRADGPDLVLASGLRFALGNKAAASWADAILNPKGRLDKLGVKAGQRIAIVNLDDAEFALDLAGRSAPLSDEAGGLDLLFYGADSQAELARIPNLILRLADRGALWIVSGKGRAATLKDVEVMAAAKAHGLVDSKVCGFSETRTALRFTRRR